MEIFPLVKSNYVGLSIYLMILITLATLLLPFCVGEGGGGWGVWVGVCVGRRGGTGKKQEKNRTSAFLCSVDFSDNINCMVKATSTQTT